MSSLRKAIGSVFTTLFWLALVLCGIECTHKPVKARRYERPLSLPDLESIEPTDTLRSAADNEFASADSRRKIVDDKARMLLTWSAFSFRSPPRWLRDLSLPTSRWFRSHAFFSPHSFSSVT
jgi:hypothetical protein